uniref:AsIV-cont00044-ORF1 n=1 Tax=Apophua simplicipes ichnovirus TaxID=1329648 RepID=S5DYU3_9VIRU|nr:AsIV-cont00044-ORF1 [Apophua simplicipes ichnovirus]
MMTTLKPKRKIAQRHEEEIQRKASSMTKLVDTLDSRKKMRPSNKNAKQEELVLRKEIETLKNENVKIQETCYSYQNENMSLQSSLKLKEKQTADLTKTVKSKERELKKIHKQMKKLSTDIEKGTATINNLEEITSSQKKEIEELQVRKEEIDKCLQDTRQACDTLNSVFIKAITGECHYMIKHVNRFFRTEFEFVVQAGLVILANEKNLPKFEKNDQNLLNKMVVCPLRSRFVTQEEFQEMTKNKENMKNIKIADDSLELQFHEWRSAILDLLIEYSNKPILTIPDSMRHWKKRVCDMYFDYTDWLNKYIRKSKNEYEFVSATQIMNQIQNSDSESCHPREMRRLKTAMDEWAKQNKYKYKHRHVYPTEKGRRTETKSVLMNATIDDVFEE